MPTTTLAMIVRDEEANLSACLESVRGLFDDTVIVDTGSTDATLKIARRFRARVFRFPWCDDFSAARNFGLDRVRTESVFRLDADDRLFPGHRKRLAATLQAIRPDRALTCPVHSIEHTGDERISQEYRLFPACCRFRGRVHERVRLEEYPGIITAPSHVRIDHLGYADEATYYAKLRRNHALLLEDARRPPVDLLTWFDLGRTEAALGHEDAALATLDRFLRLPAHGVADARRVAHRIFLETHRKRSALKEAVAAAERGLTEFADDATLLAGLADLLRATGHPELAAEGYERTLAAYDPGRINSGVPADFPARVRAALASTRAALRSVPAPATEPGCFSLQSILSAEGPL